MLFSPKIIDFWRAAFLTGDILHSDAVFTVAIDSNLSEGRRVMMLKTCDGRTLAVLTPELADKSGLDQGQELSEPIFRQKLQEARVELHGADYLFYFSEAAKSAMLQESSEGVVRRLTQQDEAVFSQFQSAASEQDLDDAYVELDHWAVFGSFEQARLVSVASAYPWQNAQIADLGALTLTTFRGKGHARKVVRSIGKYSIEQGYEPQYRCQLDNHASVALAKAAGLTLFGTWEAISPSCAD